MTISKIIGITDPSLNVGTHTYFLSTDAGEVDIWADVNTIETIPEAALFIRVNPDWPVLVLKIVGIPSMMRFLFAQDTNDRVTTEKFDTNQSVEFYNTYSYLSMTINTLVKIPDSLKGSEVFTGDYQNVSCSLTLSKDQENQIFKTIGQRIRLLTDKYKPKTKVPAKITSIQ